MMVALGLEMVCRSWGISAEFPSLIWWIQTLVITKLCKEQLEMPK